jgi:hypothetical protein
MCCAITNASGGSAESARTIERNAIKPPAEKPTATTPAAGSALCSAADTPHYLRDPSDEQGAPGIRDELHGAGSPRGTSAEASGEWVFHQERDG